MIHELSAIFTTKDAYTTVTYGRDQISLHFVIVICIVLRSDYQLEVYCGKFTLDLYYVSYYRSFRAV